MPKEKQQQLIDSNLYTEKEIPIIGADKSTEEYKSYHTNGEISEYLYA